VVDYALSDTGADLPQNKADATKTLSSPENCDEIMNNVVMEIATGQNQVLQIKGK
jgi:hypothetical protein